MVDNQFQLLADQLYRERILRARRMPPEERVMDGPRLFDYACSITMDGLRHENPGATEAELRMALRKRMELAEKLQSIR